jgi:hypothetical protein
MFMARARMPTAEVTDFMHLDTLALITMDAMIAMETITAHASITKIVTIVDLIAVGKLYAKNHCRSI